jgi:hypothetical protein
MKIVAFGGEAKVVENDKLIFKTHRVGHLHYLTMEGGMPIQEIKKELNVRQKKASRVFFSIWHDRLGHLHEAAIKKIPALAQEEGRLQGECSMCIEGKMKCAKFPVDKGEKVKNVLN